MRERIPLKENTELRFTNPEGGDMVFVITDVVGDGGSCLVYDGYYRNHGGGRNTVRIKECYPYSLHLKRKEDGTLFVEDREREVFEEYKSRMRDSFDVTNELHEASGLTNLTSGVYDRYEGNETVYVVTSYVEGTALSDVTLDSLQQAVKTVISVAKSIEKIHSRGYLYLDIKPENILIYPETTELVQLFDFDSMLRWDAEDHVSTSRIAYSQGFAPLEQRTRNRSEIGKHTDVYSLGALLFYLVFGRTPRTLDCGAEYDYSEMHYDQLCQNQVYKELTTFFHHTLQVYVKDRYPDMHEAIEQLEKIAKCAALPEVHICSTYIPEPQNVIGREEECKALWNWLQSGEKVLFVSGMGGIGKSTIVRKFLRDHEDEFDSIVYLQYKHSVVETIIDDGGFLIRGCEKEKEESAEEYFARKKKVAKRLTENSKSLLIIDNYEGIPDEFFMEILDVNWRVIVITRQDMENIGYPWYRVQELSKKNELRTLFEAYAGARIGGEDLLQFEKMVEMVAGHTLTLVLIARQMAKSYLTLSEAVQLVREHGIGAMAPEKVEYVRDGVFVYEKISSIIRRIFDVSQLSSEKRKCLKLLSIFAPYGIDIKVFRDLMEYESFDDMNELATLGWLEIQDQMVQMHPLIQEIVRQLEWTEEERRVILRELEHLPKDQESFLIENAEPLIGASDDVEPEKRMEVYDYVVYLLCQKEDYDMANQYLSRALDFAKKWKRHYIYGLYYDMLGDYYDAILNGAYDPEEPEERKWRRALWKAGQKASWHMKRSKHPKAEKLWVKYRLSHTLLLIRGMLGKPRQIKRLLVSVTSKIAQDDWKLLFFLNMAWAWYYARYEEKENDVFEYLYQAYEINEHRFVTDLDWVDDYYIPAANMMFEIGDTEQSLQFLKTAYDICSTHEEVVPYVRKMQDLILYQQEVQKESGV